MPTFVFPCRGLVNELKGEDVTLWELGAIKQVRVSLYTLLLTFVFPCRGLVNEPKGEDVTLWELGAIKQVSVSL